MGNDESKELERIRDLSVKLFEVLKAENAEAVIADMALTRLLAAIYSLQSPEVTDKLIKLHLDNLRYSIMEIRDSKAQRYEAANQALTRVGDLIKKLDKKE